MLHDPITFADIKGLRTPALKRIYTVARAAVLSSTSETADAFDAWARSFTGSDNARDLALAALGRVSLVGGRVEHPEPSPETLDAGGFLSGSARYVAGNGVSAARAIVREVRA